MNESSLSIGERVAISKRETAAEDTLKTVRALRIAAAVLTAVTEVNNPRLRDNIETAFGEPVSPDELEEARLAVQQSLESESEIAASLIHNAENIREFGLSH